MFSDTMLTLAGAIFGGLIILHINSYNVIKKKTKAEAIQKLELDSMIRIINGTDGFQEAIKVLNAIIIKLAVDIVNELQNKEKTSKEIHNLIIETEIKIMESDKNYQESKNIINKFIFSLQRDMIINGEDEAVREEEEKIIKLYNEIAFFTKSLDEKKLETLKGDDLVSYIWDLYKALDTPSRVKKCIINIWKIYKAKLDKKEKDWLDKLINFFKGDKDE